MMSVLRHNRAAGWVSPCVPSRLTSTIALLLLLLSCACGRTEREPVRSSDQALLRATALAEIEALARPDGVEPEVWDALKAQLARMVAQIEIVFGPPVHERSRVTDIAASHANDGLRLDWAYTNNGDYDQNSEVNGADLVPMAPALYKRAGDALWARWRLADGDFNSEVNPADIAPLGASFRRSVEGYEVQYSAGSSAGPYTPGARLPFSASQIPAGEFARRFSYALADAPEGWYRVVPYFEDELGIESVAVRYDPPNAPPVAVIDADTQLGEPPFTVNFDASGSFDPDGTIVHYAWNLDGNGIFGHHTGDVPTLSHEYIQPAKVTARVRVTDDKGAQAIASLDVFALSWRFIQLADNGRISHVVENEGRPVACWEIDDGSGKFPLRVACATKALPETAADFVYSEIWPQGITFGRPMASIGGRPALLFADGPAANAAHDIRLAVAKVALPESASDWDISTVATIPLKPPTLPPGTGIDMALTEIAQRPAVLLTNARQNVYTFLIALNAAPQGPEDWTSIDLSEMGTPEDPKGYGRLASFNGMASVAFTTEDRTRLHLATALVDHPQSMTDWQLTFVEEHAITPTALALTAAADEPQLIYYRGPPDRSWYVARENAPIDSIGNPFGAGIGISATIGSISERSAILSSSSGSSYFSLLMLERRSDGELRVFVEDFASAIPGSYFADKLATTGGYFIGRSPANAPPGGAAIWLGVPVVPGL